eukprot:5336769-Amphidinium_carterae.1
MAKTRISHNGSPYLDVMVTTWSGASEKIEQQQHRYCGLEDPREHLLGGYYEPFDKDLKRDGNKQKEANDLSDKTLLKKDKMYEKKLDLPKKNRTKQTYNNTEPNTNEAASSSHVDLFHIQRVAILGIRKPMKAVTLARLACLFDAHVCTWGGPFLQEWTLVKDYSND